MNAAARQRDTFQTRGAAVADFFQSAAPFSRMRASAGGLRR
jgi:hypothetical protein